MNKCIASVPMLKHDGTEYIVAEIQSGTNTIEIMDHEYVMDFKTKQQRCCKILQLINEEGQKVLIGIPLDDKNSILLVKYDGNSTLYPEYITWIKEGETVLQSDLYSDQCSRIEYIKHYGHIKDAFKILGINIMDDKVMRSERFYRLTKWLIA